MRTRHILSVLVCGICSGAVCEMAASAAAKNTTARTELQAQVDYHALKMLRKGAALLDDRQEERAVKLLSAVPPRFPKSNVRFKAMLLLGKYYAEKGEYQLAIKNLMPVTESEGAEPDERAEALYRIGVCRFGLADYDHALMTLRRATEDHPWSVFANEAYYYIGLCHFRLERWRNAVEALKLVGTSVPPNAKTQTLVESGQRFFVKIHDKDLRVLSHMGGTLSVQVTAESDDSESVPVSIFGREGEIYLGSIKTELGRPKPNDGRLQLIGGDRIKVEYVDTNAQDGSLNVKRLAASRVVSTASAGFMDGACREYVHGVFSEQNTFIQVKDFDADTSDQKDKVKVRLYSRHKLESDEQDAIQESGLEEKPEYVVLDEMELELSETEPHSGLFVGTIVVREAKDARNIAKNDASLTALDKDTIHIEYVDNEHIGGLDAPRIAKAKGDFLTGQIQDVWIAHREVDTEELRARKNLIEAKFYLRLARIFRDVGLVYRAEDKANIGLEKIGDILCRSMKVSIKQDLVEEAYKIKWELLLAKGDLNGAVRTCQTLMAMYPASSLADVALMQIAKAKMEGRQPNEALSILRAVLGFKGSVGQKAEAQFLIGSLLERNAGKRLSAEERRRAMGPAIAAYKTCADKYPDSPFAGKALGKVIDFYIDSKNYDRSLELLQSVFVDFPDAPFLDQMLLKWGVVLARMKRYSESRDKLQQLLNDYPNSSVSDKAQKFLKLVSKKIE